MTTARRTIEATVRFYPHFSGTIDGFNTVVLSGAKSRNAKVGTVPPRSATP